MTIDPLAHTLAAIITAPDRETTAALALTALAEELRPRAACLLVWDDELGRYIIGETWRGPAKSAHGEETRSAAQLRRDALRLGQAACQQDSVHARIIAPDVFYQPLNALTDHVGALIAWGAAPFADENATAADIAALDERYALLLPTVARALHTITRLQQADQEHAELEADRERLQGLLQAVEKQQREIDRLLSAERELSASLEAKVEERTAALRAAQSQLIQSEKLAVIGQLASSLAHELNNPLQAIQSGLGLAMDELRGTELDYINGDLGIIQEELERIGETFTQMLDFYRPVAHNFVPLDVNAMGEGVRVLMRKRLQETCVSLRLDLAETLPQTCGDSNQIKQVLINLILNAAEAISDTGQDGTITLRSYAANGAVCIAIRDDGPGIAPEHQRRLFEPLFTTKQRGLGLGLAISQEIARRHGGRIDVTSERGVGTTFTLHLPIREHCAT